jgi:hypothetical protein
MVPEIPGDTGSGLVPLRLAGAGHPEGRSALWKVAKAAKIAKATRGRSGDPARPRRGAGARHPELVSLAISCSDYLPSEHP